jgi:hypothetical protein
MDAADPHVVAYIDSGDEAWQRTMRSHVDE